MTVIQMQNVSKEIKSRVILNHLNFNFEENQIIGFLGKNGSGKTSLMKIIAGEWDTTSGDVLVNGQKPFNNQNVLGKICFIQEGNNFPSHMKISDLLKLCKNFYPNWNHDIADTLLTLFDLDSTKRIKELSKGMESAVGVLVGIASRSEITIFDEPYIGMDANARKKFYQFLLNDYIEMPRTIIFSTHLIDEVSTLFQKVYVINKGKLLLEISTEELQEVVYSISGPREEMEKIKDQFIILDEKYFMGNGEIVVFDQEKQHDDALPSGCKKNIVNVQDIIVHVTEKGEQLR
ncbi:ATP-binding cassette domain-containing protein [Rummeliibacillus pycnus]|uniref:ATP-binding cassette domain-containing protein n=1 Tax=Rummeliibacillus pycnus TaxID=101070 RepID=UPI000C9AF485|nr:ABC transporter ATP-binding protein [Rummeliibacillus pycnus]